MDCQKVAKSYIIRRMNPQSTEHTGLNLPSPVPEQAPVGAGSSETAPSVTESTLSRPEQSNGVAQPAALPPVPMPSAGVVANPLNNDSNTATASKSSSGINAADDGDLIEKEWVSKAKQIVEHTRDDPHEQSKELTEFKADYMQKRYNKIIKLSE
jgi:hypothetical protein